MLDTLGGGSVFSVFDLFSGFTQLTIHPDTIPLTAFCTPNGLYEWPRMPPGAAGTPVWFVSVLRLVTAGLDNILMYLDDAIGPDDCLLHHVATLATFFARLRLYKLTLSPDKSRISAARVEFLGHVILADGVRPNDALGATLEQEQPDGSIRPIVYISRDTLDKEQNWTPMELEAGCVVWSIRPLRRYLFGVYFLVFTDHQCLQQICKIGETEPRIQRWMEFLSACNFRLSYRRGQENANADFLSRLPLPPIADDVSGASALTDPDDLGVYLIRACGLTTPSCPVPGVGLGGLVPSPDIQVLGGLAPSPDIPVLGGLPLTSDDVRTHRAPMPSPSATIRPRHPRATFPQAPYTTYAINACDDAPRPTRRTRSQTAILDGNTPSRSDYRTGRPQWVRRVRRCSVSSAPHVAASALGPPRLHDLPGSSRPD